LADYLALRRALGYRLARPEKLLNQFLDHLDQAGESRITVAVTLDWARLPANGSSNWWAYRLAAVRGFATYLHAIDPVHEVPAAQLLPQRAMRASPVLVLRGRHRGADRGHRLAANATTTGHVRHADRVAGSDGDSSG
jgi:hypothetical protein